MNKDHFCVQTLLSFANILSLIKANVQLFIIIKIARNLFTNQKKNVKNKNKLKRKQPKNKDTWFICIIISSVCVNDKQK